LVFMKLKCFFTTLVQ